MQEVVRTWYPNYKISSEHTILEIKQIYVWVVSSDNKVAIVSKSNGQFQFPGGHPEKGESLLDTALREVYEEAGFDISPFESDIKQFGYYLIEEDGEKYLQLRLLLILKEHSDIYPLKVNEKKDEERPVQSARWVSLFDLPEYIPWTKGLEEYNKVIVAVKQKTVQ